MELWIRSQDKMELFNAKDIWIPNDADTSIWGQDGLRKTALGFYKSTKRALEVLDEIEGKITQNECLKTMIPKLNNLKGEEEKIGKLFRKMVYEMPED